MKRDFFDEKIFDIERVMGGLSTFLIEQYKESERRNLIRFDKERLKQIRNSKLQRHGEDLEHVLNEVTSLLSDNCINVLSSKYFGYITPRPLPIGIIGDWLSMIGNQTPGAWRAGPLATEIEWCVLNWVREFIGYGVEFSDLLPPGVVTSGGSLGNLMALHVARNKLDIGRNGIYYVSTDVHHSIYRSFDILDIHEDRIRVIDTDRRGSMDLLKLRDQIQMDVSDNKIPICVVLTYGTTVTGAIDFVDRTRELIESYGNIWIHVDAASGGVYANSETFIDKYGSIINADSFVVDPSKWLFMSYSIGMLFMKNSRDMLDVYSSSPDYWLSGEEHDNFQMSFNGTRAWRTLGMYLAFKVYGREWFKDTIMSLTRTADYIENTLVSKGFDVIRGSDLPIILFTHNNWDDFTIEKICEIMVEENIAYFTVAKFKAKTYMRISINNYTTSTDDWDCILQSIIDKFGCF